MAKLKIGFIGCGGIANQKHLPGMAQQTEFVDLVAFCDLISRARREGRQGVRHPRRQGVHRLSRPAG